MQSSLLCLLACGIFQIIPRPAHLALCVCLWTAVGSEGFQQHFFSLNFEPRVVYQNYAALSNLLCTSSWGVV